MGTRTLIVEIDFDESATNTKSELEFAVAQAINGAVDSKVKGYECLSGLYVQDVRVRDETPELRNGRARRRATAH